MCLFKCLLRPLPFWDIKNYVHYIARATYRKIYLLLGNTFYLLYNLLS